MKIKINATVTQLETRGIDRAEARRLAGAIVDTVPPLKCVIWDDSEVYWVANLLGPETNSGNPWYVSREWCEVVPPMFDTSKPLQTRDGRPVEIKFVDDRLDYPIVGVVTGGKDGKSECRTWRPDGTVYSHSRSVYDLMSVPEKPIERWVAIITTNYGYATQAEAQKALSGYSSEVFKAVVKVTFKNGEGL